MIINIIVYRSKNATTHQTMKWELYLWAFFIIGSGCSFLSGMLWYERNISCCQFRRFICIAAVLARGFYRSPDKMKYRCLTLWEKARERQREIEREREREREREWVKEIYICLAVLNWGICRMPLHGFWRKLDKQFMCWFCPQPHWLLPSVPCCFCQQFSEANHRITWVEHHVDAVSNRYTVVCYL